MDHNADGESWTVHVRRNPSWVASVRTTLKRVVYYGPSSWWWLVGPPLRALLSAIVVVPALTVFWVICTCGLLLLGMAGFVTEPESAEEGQ